MGTELADTRVTLSKGQFLQIFRWHKQLPLKGLATLTGISVGELATLEHDQQAQPAGSTANGDRLAELLGCTNGMWERVGIDPGFPGTSGPASPGKAAPKAPSTFAEQINRISAMPESFRARQLQVIQKELGYIDV
ncbi:MAG: hypothetical protein H7338_13285 [Candidatus Sericytochromatia bacterium]|nr:hypothetical protein [Candidatus Sericytochromatia bacterium]